MATTKTKPGAPRLMGQSEIATRLGVTGTRVGQLTHDPDFPLPLAHLRAGKVWLADDIEAWAAEHRPTADPDT